MIPNLTFRTDTEVNADSCNFGLINSMISQNFNNGINLGGLLFAILCVLMVLAAIFIFVILRQINYHGAVLRCHGQALHDIVARDRTPRSVREAVK